METPVQAAIISSTISLFGLLVNGAVIGRWLRKQDITDSWKTKKRDARLESLKVLFHATSIAKSAARDLANRSPDLGLDELIHRTADSLQKMSQFFQKASEAERDLYLTANDVHHVKEVQNCLAKQFVLLDPNPSDPTKYHQDMMAAYGDVEKEATRFRAYVESTTTD